ncbi:MAG: PEP-CTERM sorting domain-containing protein [Phycisphaerales bacterium]|nr:PEP-CTERM sorting domain-containing protein [Phycisphaerales bacterium]
MARPKMRQTVNNRRCSAIVTTGVTLWAALWVAPAALGGEIRTWTHEGAGQGTARVFDGGPVVTSMGYTTGSNDALFTFAATDFTRVGARGATYSTGGESDVRINGDAMTVVVNFNTTYNGGISSQDDHTGGEGQGSLWSVVELVMPQDELTWITSLIIHDTGWFSGDTFVKFENVTKGTTLLELDSPFYEWGTLVGETGDVIRITSEMSGQGFFPTTVTLAYLAYEGSLNAVFIVPEPTTLVLLAFGISIVFRRRRWLP